MTGGTTAGMCASIREHAEEKRRAR